MYRPLLAETLQQIADGGPDVFYNDGPLRDTIVSEIQNQGRHSILFSLLR